MARAALWALGCSGERVPGRAFSHYVGLALETRVEPWRGVSGLPHGPWQQVPRRARPAPGWLGHHCPGHSPASHSPLGRGTYVHQGPGVPAVPIASSRKVPMFGLEAIWRNGQVVGHVRRADFGFAVDKTIAYGYIQNPSGGPVSPVPWPCLLTQALPDPVGPTSITQAQTLGKVQELSRELVSGPSTRASLDGGKGSSPASPGRRGHLCLLFPSFQPGAWGCQ